MFLRKRLKVKKVRFLFNRYFVDTWSRILRKKKIHNKTTKRFLSFFSKYMVAPRIPRGFRRRRRRARPRMSRKAIFFRGLLFANRRAQDHVRALLRRKFRHLLYNYHVHKRLHNTTGPLFRIWSRKFDFTRVKLKGRSRRRFYRPRPPKKFVYLRRKRDYLLTPLMDTVLQQYHFGFSSLNSFKYFLERNASKLGAGKLVALGIEGMLANQLCRAGIVNDIRNGYVLVKSGAVAVNSRQVRNPRKVLIVGDVFSILFPFNKLMLRSLRKRLKLKLQIFNLARYLEYNFRLMTFKIYRSPTKSELSIITYFPYYKNTIDVGAVKYFVRTFKRA